MNTIRIGTCILLAACIGISILNKRSQIPIALEPPSYEQQASVLLATGTNWKSIELPIAPRTPLIDGTEWQRKQGPDFDVWQTAITIAKHRAIVGMYVGGFPDANPPTTSLTPGTFSGLPVLWWKSPEKNGFSTINAIIPLPKEKNGFKLHVWVRVEDTAILPEVLKLVAQPNILLFPQKI